MVSKYYGIILTPPPHACMFFWHECEKALHVDGWMDEWILAASSDESGISKKPGPMHTTRIYHNYYFQEFMCAFPNSFFFKLPKIPCQPMGDVQKTIKIYKVH